MKKDTYTDIDLSFAAHPLTGDVAKKTDLGAIKQAVRLLCRVAHGDFVHDIDISGSTDHLLFSTNGSMLAYNLEKHITQVINNHEPRVEIVSVLVGGLEDLSQQEVVVQVSFMCLNLADPQSVDVIVKRTR